VSAERGGMWLCRWPTPLPVMKESNAHMLISLSSW
jgi:hypothetical protein